MNLLPHLKRGVKITDLKSIFNHPKKKNDQENNTDLYNWEKPFHSKDDVRELNHLLKLCGKRRNCDTSRRKSAGSVYAKSHGNPLNRKQRVMFKMTYGNNIQNHKKYIKLYMPQIGKEGVTENPELFGCTCDEYEKIMSPLHFKCIISPESQNIDLKALTEGFVRKLEKLSGYKFYWMGAIHTDTGHSHAHVSINGIDRNGRGVHFPKDFIRNTMREILSGIATDMIGERSYEEIQASVKNQTRSKRWTGFDEQLKKYTGRIFIREINQSLTNRLQFLNSIGLAEKDGLFYSLNPDFEEVLKTTGRYNTYLEEYLKSDELPLHLFEGGSISGVVDRVIFFDRDESWNDAIVIRTSDKRVYVPVYQLHKEKLEGKTVLITDSKGGLNRNLTDKNIKVIGQNRSIER